MKIKVGFSKPNSWKPFAKLIMLAYNVPYDHVYIKYDSAEMGRTMIFQASKMAVNLVSEDMFLSENIVVKEFEVDITDQQMKDILEFTADNLGKPYGIKECVGLGIVRVAQLFGKRINNPFSFDGSTYVCSELAGYVCEKFIGMDIDSDPANINPKEIYDYLCEKLGD